MDVVNCTNSAIRLLYMGSNLIWNTVIHRGFYGMTAVDLAKS